MKSKRNIILLFIVVFIFFSFYLFNYLNNKKSLFKNQDKIIDQNINKEANQRENDPKNDSSSFSTSDSSKKDQDSSQSSQNKDISNKDKKVSTKTKDELKKEILSLLEDDLYLGNKDSDNIIIEYTSVTCPHCKKFHDDVFNDINKKFIESDKVLYIIRDFPTDSLSFRSTLVFSRIKDKLTLDQKRILRKCLMKGQEPISKTVFELRSKPKEAFVAAMGILKDIFKTCANLSEKDFEAFTNLEDPETKKIGESIISKITDLSTFLGEESGAPTFLLYNKRTQKFKKLEGIKQIKDWEITLAEINN